MSAQSRIDYSIALLRRAEPLALKIHPDGFHLAFSGDKDSQVLYHLAQMAGVKFRAHMQITTLDPPERTLSPRVHYQTRRYSGNEKYRQTMKSKRARTIIWDGKFEFTVDSVHVAEGRAISKLDADKAVELAEEDARERAARTFCKLQRLDCEVYCTPCTGAECVGRNEFLKYYDNELD